MAQADVQRAVAARAHPTEGPIVARRQRPQGPVDRADDVVDEVGLRVLPGTVHALGVVQPAVPDPREHDDHRPPLLRGGEGGGHETTCPQPVQRYAGGAVQQVEHGEATGRLAEPLRRQVGPHVLAPCAADARVELPAHHGAARLRAGRPLTQHRGGNRRPRRYAGDVAEPWQVGEVGVDRVGRQHERQHRCQAHPGRTAAGATTQRGDTEDGGEHTQGGEEDR